MNEFTQVMSSWDAPFRIYELSSFLNLQGRKNKVALTRLEPELCAVSGDAHRQCMWQWVTLKTESCGGGGV